MAEKEQIGVTTCSCGREIPVYLDRKGRPYAYDSECGTRLLNLTPDAVRESSSDPGTDDDDDDSAGSAWF